MKLFLAFLLIGLTNSAQAAEHETLTCLNSKGNTLEWDEYNGELTVSGAYGKTVTDKEYLTLGDSETSGKVTVIEIVNDKGNYSSVAQIVKTPKKIMIVFENDTFVCK